jgi:flavin reductase (DIM6/NTAB) family NADH-FMN oxidoreductase RutF
MQYDPRTELHGLPHSPVTSLVVPRPIGWISTIGAEGQVNLAPYSFFNLISSHPPFVMFSSAPRKDSQTNAERTGEFVASIATEALQDVMNASSADYGAGVSEPEVLGLEMAPSRSVMPPRVARSPIALECKLANVVSLVGSDGRLNRSTVVIGEVVGIYIDDDVLVDGLIDISRVRPLARLGYLDYCVVDSVFPIKRPRKPATPLNRD